MGPEGGGPVGGGGAVGCIETMGVCTPYCGIIIGGTWKAERKYKINKYLKQCLSF